MFDIRILTDQIGKLVREENLDQHPLSSAAVNRHLHDLDVLEAGFILEDEGKIPEADEVFDLTLGKLHELLQD